MLELLKTHGFNVETKPAEISSAGVPMTKSLVDLIPMMTMPEGSKGFVKRKGQRGISELNKLSKSALPSRAITVIRNGIASLEYGLQPQDPQIDDQEKIKYEEAKQIIKNVLDNPNPHNEDFSQFSGELIEDILKFDAGAVEYVERPTYFRRNNTLALEIVPGYSLDQNPNWSGNEDSIRWRQRISSSKYVHLRDRDIEYFAIRKTSDSLWGYSPLEAAVDIMDSWIHLVSYQKQIASTSYPPILIYLGEKTTKEQAAALRVYWQREMEGKGRPGMWGNTGKPEVLDLKNGGDERLYLTYQEMLVRILAFTFGLKPQDFGVERDVNRSTADVSYTASVEEARKPIASMIARRINNRIIPRIAEVTKNKYVALMKFFWEGLTLKDRKINAEVHEVYLKQNATSLDEVRNELDQAPYPNGLGTLPPVVLEEFSKKEPVLAFLMFTGQLDSSDPRIQEKLFSVIDDVKQLPESSNLSVQ